MSILSLLSKAHTDVDFAARAINESGKDVELVVWVGSDLKTIYVIRIEDGEFTPWAIIDYSADKILKPVIGGNHTDAGSPSFLLDAAAVVRYNDKIIHIPLEESN